MHIIIETGAHLALKLVADQFKPPDRSCCSLGRRKPQPAIVELENRRAALLRAPAPWITP